MAKNVLPRFDASLEQFIISVVKKAEAKEGDRYRASFAGGKSGLSFGAFQNDVAANGHARDTFRKILTHSGLFSSEEINEIMKSARKEGARREDLAPFIDRIDRALSSEAGRRVIDARDEDQKKALLSGMETFLAAVWGEKDRRGPGVFDRPFSDPEFRQAVTLVAAWINRTGTPTKIIEFVKGKKVDSEWEKDSKKVRTERRLPPTGPITLKDFVAPHTGYFSGRLQFSKAGNGEDFEKWFKRITENLPPLALPRTADGSGSDAPEAETEAFDDLPAIDIPGAPATSINGGTDDPLDDARAREDRDADEDEFTAGGRGDDTLYGGSGEDRLKAEADRLIASDDYYRDQDKQARVAAIFTELYPPDAEPDTAAATPAEDPFEIAPVAPDPETQEALQAEANALIASADYWRDPHKQRRVAAIFKRLYPGSMRTAPLDVGEGV